MTFLFLEESYSHMTNTLSILLSLTLNKRISVLILLDSSFLFGVPEYQSLGSPPYLSVTISKDFN